MIVDLKMILKKLFNLINLFKTQVFCIHKIIEIILISKNKNLIFIALKIIMTSLKCINNNQEIAIMSFCKVVNL